MACFWAVYYLTLKPLFAWKIRPYLLTCTESGGVANKAAVESILFFISVGYGYFW